MNGNNAWWRTCAWLALVLLRLEAAPAVPMARLQTNDVVGLIGGGVWVAEQRGGYLESALRQLHPGYQLRVRNFAWEGDTVSSRPREMNYPTVPALLRRFGVTIAFLQFGQSESFAGEAGLETFRRDYGRLLDEVAAATPRLVLVTPLPFESTAPPLADLARRNADLARYVAVVHELGALRGLPVIDLYASGKAGAATGLTTDGRQLSDRGEAVAALGISQALVSSGRPTSPDPAGWFAQPAAVSLRQAVVAKNLVWRQYVRPTNWAFLAGDRVEQPSSRDHRDRNLRWFPGEMEQFGPLLQQAERQLDNPISDAR